MGFSNLEHVIHFCPKVSDASWANDRSALDLFIYTEMIDRGSKKGNNSQRILKTFYHRSEQELREQMPSIKALCDMANVRAYTRLGMRSFAKVGRVFTKLVVDAAMAENWGGMKTLYARACGTVKPEAKLWLWDVDDVTHSLSGALLAKLTELDVVRAIIPSKSGVHYVTVPFDPRALGWAYGNDRVASNDGYHISLHKDNPVNLYIPDGAD